MLSLTKGIIFYTDGEIEDPIKSWVQDRLLKTGLPITSSSLKGPTIGLCEIIDLQRSYKTMVRQILSCLERSREDIVFFTEHDVLYPQSHFDFTPEKNDIYYYNENVWRWDYPTERYFTYDRLISLSGMCCYRKLAIDHYQKRLNYIDTMKYDGQGEPNWVRKMGYEPGTKKIKRGGFTDEDFETWRSKDPIIDIRHNKTFSPRKVNLEDFKHKPKNFKEIYERP